MTIPLPHISDQTTGDAWSYRATLQINQDTNRIDNIESVLTNIRNDLTSADLTALTTQELAQMILNRLGDIA